MMQDTGYYSETCGILSAVSAKFIGKSNGILNGQYSWCHVEATPGLSGRLWLKLSC